MIPKVHRLAHPLRGAQKALLYVLLVMDGVALAGCVTSLIMRHLVFEMMAVYRDEAQIMAVYNLLDHLIPYYLFYAGALLVLGATTACVWLASRRARLREDS